MKLALVLIAAAALSVLTLAARAGPEPLEVTIVVSPSTVYLDSQGTWVTVHAEIAYSEVAGATVTLDGVPVTFTKADSRGEFVAKFQLEAVKLGLEPGTVILTLAGWTSDGVPFTGSDEVGVRTAEGQGSGD